MKEQFIVCLVLIQLATTLFMTGVIWFVQIVHYPLMAQVGNEAVPRYQHAHTTRTAWVVGPPMVVEAITAVLLIWFRPPGIAEWAVWMGGGLLAGIWLSTALIQVPCHERLKLGYDPAVHQRLVASNWLRTVGWSARSVLVLWMIWRNSG